MSIIRTAKVADPYARIDNRALRDIDLSWKARGLLAYLLSMPDNWETNIEHLAKQGPDGRAAVAAGLKELETHGYLTRRRVRGPDGRMSGWESTVHETPPKAENPIIGKTVNRENRESDNRPLRTTEVKNEVIKEQPTLLVIAEELSFDAFWDAYPRKDEKRRAETAWGKATKTADRKTIIDAARAYAADPNRMDQFTKQAPTWLNGECWNDPPLPSRTNATASIDRATERLKQRQAAGIPNFFDPGPPRQIAAGD